MATDDEINETEEQRIREQMDKMFEEQRIQEQMDNMWVQHQMDEMWTLHFSEQTEVQETGETNMSWLGDENEIYKEDRGNNICIVLNESDERRNRLAISEKNLCKRFERIKQLPSGDRCKKSSKTCNNSPESVQKTFATKCTSQ